MDLITFLVFVVVTLLITNLASLYYVYKFSRIILSFEDSIEDALENLDDVHSEISSVLETPLFYDSPEVRKVLGQIDKARNVVVNSASKIANIFEQKELLTEKDEAQSQNMPVKPINSSVVDELFEKRSPNMFVRK